MKTITDFESWLDNNVETIEDAYCLQQAILNKENYGSYDFSSNGEKYFIKAFAEPLMLASIKARDTFLSMLEKRYAYEGLSLESSYDYNRQMEKDD